VYRMADPADDREARRAKERKHAFRKLSNEFMAA
jgi:hypothetical protein